MTWLPLALLAFASMTPQDVLSVLLVRAETAGRAHRAAVCDVLQDACGLTSLGSVAGAVLSGGVLELSAVSAAVLAGRFAGDYLGTWLGVKLGVWLDERKARR